MRRSRVRRGRPWILALGLLAAGLAPAGCSRARPAALDRWNVLLLTLDTTRADRLGCLGRPAAGTPVLDRIARAGTVFENAVAQAPLTLPAHASIMTGTYPPFHGVRYNGSYSLPPARRTLAEALRDRGYQTAAVVAAFVLERRFGLSQGFDRYDDDPRAMLEKGGDPRRSAPAVTAAALDAAASFEPDRPFFLWVHYFDPHVPYAPPPAFAARFPGTPGGRYQGEIAAMDGAIGDLLRGLEEQDRMRRTMIVVVGDHGEGFPGPHEESQHGLFLYGDTLRVPCILAARGALPQGRLSGALARQIDLAPTILDLVGAGGRGGAGDDLQGRSLAPLLLPGGGMKPAPEPASYAESFVPWMRYGWSPLFEIRRGRWKLVAAPKPELYDLRADPAERRNVASSHPELVADLRRRLREIRDARPEGTEPLEPRRHTTPSEAERLRALGYVASQERLPDPAKTGDLKDPKEWIRIEAQVQGAWSLHLASRYEEALARLERILGEDPENPEALRQRGMNLLALHRFEEAESTLALLARLRPDALRNLAQLAAVKMKLSGRLRDGGQIESADAKEREAVRLLEEIMRKDRLSTAAPLNLGARYLARKNPQEAERCFRRAVAVDPRSFEGQYGLTAALLALHRLEEAKPHLEVARRLAGSDPRRRERVRHLSARFGR